MTALTIAFTTGRRDPHLDWALDGLAGQIRRGDRIEILVIDALAGTRPHDAPILDVRELDIIERIDRLIPDDFTIEIHPPKPTIWQGEHRITAADWWATSNARNTAICLATTDYLAFVDDRSRLGPRWLETLRDGEIGRAGVLVGSYDKLEDGRRTTDHRRGLCPDGKINCGGGWLYGCSAAMPLGWLLEVNGFEEGCDSLGSEDYILGLMLGNLGRRIDFVPALYVEQDRSAGTEHVFLSTDKGISPNDKSHAALARFGSRSRTEFTPDLGAIRHELAAGGAFPIPDPLYDWRDWWDNQPVREMTSGVLPKDKPKG